MAVGFTLLDFNSVFLNIRVANIFEQRLEFVVELYLCRDGLKVQAEIFLIHHLNFLVLWMAWHAKTRQIP